MVVITIDDIFTCRACKRRRSEYLESYGLKTMEAAAIAAAVSAATSEPGCSQSTLYAVLGVVMSSALSQQIWSESPSPTFSRFTTGCRSKKNAFEAFMLVAESLPAPRGDRVVCVLWRSNRFPSEWHRERTLIAPRQLSLSRTRSRSTTASSQRMPSAIQISHDHRRHSSLLPSPPDKEPRLGWSKQPWWNATMN